MTWELSQTEPTEEESGRVLIPRVVRSVGETASELLGNAPNA